MNERIWITGGSWYDDDGYVVAASWPLLVLSLNGEGGSFRSSLPSFLGRAFELIFSGPRVHFEWHEVQLVERVEQFVVFHGVRFKIMQRDELKLFIVVTSEGTIAQILDYVQAWGANVSHLKRRMWRAL
jgi:hypothetical protein